MCGGRCVWIALVALLVMGTGWAAAWAASGGVHVSTLPSDADVWIDGTYVGRSPLVVEGLEQGRHTLTVTKAGWTSQELPLDVPADSLATAGVQLTASSAKPSNVTGTFIVRRVPAGAQVSIDGHPASMDPKGLPVPSGMHRVTLTPARGAPITQSVVIYPDTSTALALLDAAPASSRAAVLAQASEYLPDGSYNVSGGRFIVHYGGHEVAGNIGATAVRYDGVTVTYDCSPAIIDGRLYLPLAFLEKLTGKSAKAR